MKLLIIYPHGLGDCILATPAIKQLKLNSGDFIGVAMLERFKSSELFKHNPYVDEVVYTKDPWNDFGNRVRWDLVIREAEQIAKNKDYDKTIFINHTKKYNKIQEVAEILNVTLIDNHTEIYTSCNDVELAHKFVDTTGSSTFGFIHGSSPSLPSKNFPNDYGQQYLSITHELSNFIEVGLTFNVNIFNINIQFEIMRLAQAVCLIDSVFYHACAAMDKTIDFAYFKRGQSVFNRVKPMHEVDQNVFFNLPSL